MYAVKRTVMLSALGCLSLSAMANDSSELEKLRGELEMLRKTYNARIEALEQKLAEKSGLPVDPAPLSAAATPVAPAAPSMQQAVFNPGISLILNGRYTNRSNRGRGNYYISGFEAGGEIAPGKAGFSLGESELAAYAPIDPYLFGGIVLSYAGDKNEVSAEEAFIQSTALPAGWTVKGGRFYSGVGYLNEKHPHAWDFADAPLAYQAMLGRQFRTDGIQIKWLAPTDIFLEIGTELGNGVLSAARGREKNGGTAGSVFAHMGGDVGDSQSWRAGVSYLRASLDGRISYARNVNSEVVSNTFNGNSQIWVADFVWKWAPHGNPYHTSLIVQGEYLRRSERGMLNYNNSNNAPYQAEDQEGWYVQSLYQFMHGWRAGIRYDYLDNGTVNYAANGINLSSARYNPSRFSTMLDYSPSEFSRFRLQWSQDQARRGITDNQITLQYLMSLGAHGAHTY